MKKMNDPGGPVMKPLAELTLLDRFYLHVLWRTAGPWNCAGGSKRGADRAASLHRADL